MSHGNGVFEAEFLQVEAVDEGVDEPDRVLFVNVFVECVWERVWSGLCGFRQRARSLLFALFVAASSFSRFPGFIRYDEVDGFAEVFFWAGYFCACSVGCDFSFYEADDSGDFDFCGGFKNYFLRHNIAIIIHLYI